MSCPSQGQLDSGSCLLPDRLFHPSFITDGQTEAREGPCLMEITQQAVSTQVGPQVHKPWLAWLAGWVGGVLGLLPPPQPCFSSLG